MYFLKTDLNINNPILISVNSDHARRRNKNIISVRKIKNLTPALTVDTYFKISPIMLLEQLFIHGIKCSKYNIYNCLKLEY